MNLLYGRPQGAPSETYIQDPGKDQQERYFVFEPGECQVSSGQTIVFQPLN